MKAIGKWRTLGLALLLMMVGAGGTAWGQEAVAAPDLTAGMSDLRVGLDTVWVLIAAMLVFLMNTGFAMVESGLCRAKNTVNILAKNFIVFAVASMSFWVIGWGLMFGDGNLWVGLQGLFFASGADNSPALGAAYASMNPFSAATYEGVYSAINWTPVPLWAKFFFQLVFAGTAATIVSGAVAERVKLGSFLIFSTIYVAIGYPIAGSWVWGGGWLADLNFHDFAGSTLVHSVGGWGALAGALLLGPRLGKYVNGGIRPIMGHNMPMVVTGVFLLWLGWFGFNGGSVLSADAGAVSYVLVTMSLAAAAGIVTSMLTSWGLQKKPDLTMVLNGCLAGLVGITAGADCVSVPAAVAIGGIAGVLVVLAVMGFDQLKIDDPVGAISVHLVCGIWGTLAAGLFSANPDFTLKTQALGVLAYGLFCFPLCLAIFAALKVTIGLRVSRAEEIGGLDVGEHGMEAYPDFQGFLTK